MALPDITQRLRLQAEGVRETEASSKNIHDNLAGAAKAADALSRAQANAARKAGMQTTKENIDYNQMRGVAGATGAAGRDFADQARGLGGLVRLYATFAANIFAVSAAFNVLRNAADTTNLVAGLNTLGAVSGKALGTLSQRLAEASDGAISMREAMTSVAMTSSAGMSSQNILRLGAVAKNASIALGISMPDAINRLSRGIVKLEPELLDELGIFTKIEPATQAYALQLGKAASQLTDFERRQAFANAVLKEGEDKFAALAEAAANPYDKLLAGLKNTAQSGLELINKVLLPIVSLLAKSPTALALGLGAVIALLLKQAVPAITQVRAGLAAAADDALKEAKGKAGDAVRAREQLNKLIEARVEASADKELRILEDKEAQLEGLKRKGYKVSEGLNAALKKDIVDLSQAELDAARKSVESVEKRAAKAKPGGRLQQQAQIERETFNALQAQYDAEQKLVAVKEQNRVGIVKQLEATREYRVLQTSVNDLEENAKKRAIINNMAYNTTLVGITNAFKLMKMEITASGLALGTWQTGLLYIRAGLAGLVGLVSTLGAAINSAFAIIATVGAVFAVFDSIFSKNERQMRGFDSALDAVGESVNNVTRTIDALEAKGAFGGNIIDRASAISNAFGEIADSAQLAITSAKKAQDAMSGFDKAKDSFFSLFGGGVSKNLAKSLSEQFKTALELLRREGISEDYETAFKEILNVNNLSADTVKQALVTLSDEGKQRFADLLGQARGQLAKTASALQGFRDSTDKAYKSYQEFLQSTANTNPLFKLGADLQTVSMEMIRSFSEGTKAVAAAFEDLEKNPAKAALFGPEFVAGFVDIKDAFLVQTKTIQIYTEQLQKAQTRVKELRDEEQKLAKMQVAAKELGPKDRGEAFTSLAGSKKNLATELARKRDERAAQEEQVAAYANVLDNVLSKDKIAPATELFKKGINTALSEGARLISVALGQAGQKASLEVAKSTISALSGARRAEAERDLELKSIDIRIDEIKTNIALIRQQELLISAIALNTAVNQQKTIDESETSTEAQKQAAKDARDAAQMYAQFAQGSKVSVEGASEAAQMMFKAQKLGFENRKAAQQASLKEAEGSRLAAKKKGDLAIIGGSFEDNQRLIKLEQEINNETKTRLGLLAQISSETNSTLLKQESEIENEIMLARQKQATDDIQNKITQARISIDDNISDAENTRYRNEIVFLEQLLALTNRRNKAETDNKGIIDRTKLLNKDLLTIQRASELEKAKNETQYAASAAQIEIDKARFTSQAELLNLDKEFATNQIYKLDLQKSNLDAQKREADIKFAYNVQEQEARKRIEALGEGETERAREINTELDRQKTLRDEQLRQLGVERDTRNEILNIQRQQTLEQIRQAEKLDEANRLSSALAGVFGTTGQKLGEISTALVQSSLDQQKNQQALAVLQDKRLEAIQSEASSKEDIENIDKAIRRTSKKATDDELAGTAKALGSAKKLFKEKTGAYKTLNALEKAYHVMRMINMGIELATEIKNIAVSLSAKASGFAAEKMMELNNFLSKQPMLISEIYAKTFGQLGIFGPPVAAALVALAFGAMGGGKGSRVNTAGLTAEDMNAVAGTGQKYVDGKIEIREGGVTGDPTALADSITSSIEILSQDFFDILNSDSSKVVRSLRGVESNTEATVKALLGEISGFAGVSQSPFGTTERQLATEGFLGFSESSIDTKILSGGITIQGRLEDIINRTGNRVLENWERSLTTIVTSDFWGLFGDDVDEILTTLRAPLSNRVEEAIRKTLKSFRDVMDGAAVLLEGTSDRVLEQINNFRLDLGDVNLKGLNGEEAISKLTGEFSIQLNQLTLSLYSWLGDFNKVNEEIFETAARLGVEGEQLRYGLNMIGKSIDTLGTYARVVIEQDLIEQAGGLEEFADGIKYFFENFLSDTEQFEFNQKRLSDAFKEVGLTLPETKEAYKQLVQSAELSTSELARKQFVTLTNLSEDFDKLFSGKEAELKKIADERTNLEEKLIELSLSTLELREKEVNKLDITNRELQRQIYAQEDFVDTTKSLQSSLIDVTKTIKSQIQTLKEYRNNLALGDQSTLNTVEQYALAKSNIENLLTTINRAAVTPDEVQTRSEAIGKLNSATDRWLQLSRSLYASGAQYTIDFNTVLGIIDTVGASLESQLTDAERQLQQLIDSNKFLQKIENSTKTTAQLLGQYLAQGGVPISTTNSFAVGTNYVPKDMVAQIHEGERIIPAADNFKLMTTVNSTNNYNREMLLEIKQLNEKINSLEQTVANGAVVNANATNRNTEEITQAVLDSISKSVQANRLQNKSGIK